MADLKFTAHARSGNSTKTIVEARNFKIIIDEPTSLGGTDEGANPVEYVLAALAGCLNVVGHMIAKEMSFELRGMEIELEGELNPAKLMGRPTQIRSGYNNIKVVIKPDTDCDRATLEKWLEAVESRCPVSDNIANATPLELILG